MHVFLHFKSFCLVVLQLILASKSSELEQFKNFSAKRQFFARFSNCSNSLNFKAKINFKTTRQNDLKWRKTCTGLKFDLEHFNGPHIKFLRDSLYKHPVASIKMNHIINNNG